MPPRLLPDALKVTVFSPPAGKVSSSLPFAPHLAEELFSKLGGNSGAGTIAYEKWPEYDASLLVEDTVEIPIQINGKLRARLTVRRTASKAEMEALASKASPIQPFIEGKTVRKIIVVPQKLVNLVID